MAAPAPSAGTQKRSWLVRTREPRFAAALLIPSVIVVFGIVLYPILRTLYTSFFTVDTPFPGTYPFVGLENYGKIITDPAVWAAIGRTAYFTLLSTALEIGLGIGLALLLNAKLRLRWLFRAIVVLPWALPTVVNAQMWRFILNSQYGALNALLTQLHIIGSYQSWLGSPFLALNMVTMADVWKNTSLVAFFLLAGLQTISSDLHEAAVVDGASPWQRFWRITMPLLKSSILVVLVLRTIEAFKVFDIIYIMTRGGPANGTQSIAYFTYVRAFSDENFGYGSALAYLIVIVILVLAAFYIRALRSSAANEI
ncbi:sugar ABC transporter permease [Fodinicola feengrottensis]|uniref:Sugar ABC transporter permease n=1 Tax=Fodinicola feengrottensis TaxID=435914 RepID=A0ABN2G019_9ACTN